MEVRRGIAPGAAMPPSKAPLNAGGNYTLAINVSYGARTWRLTGTSKTINLRGLQRVTRPAPEPFQALPASPKNLSKSPCKSSAVFYLSGLR